MYATISYLPSINRFADSCGIIIHDLCHLFDTWQLDAWKQKGHTSIIVDKYGNDHLIEYLNEDEEDDVFQLIGWNESYGIKMDRPYYLKEEF